jgi:hypothetical protein
LSKTKSVQITLTSENEKLMENYRRIVQKTMPQFNASNTHIGNAAIKEYVTVEIVKLTGQKPK